MTSIERIELDDRHPCERCGKLAEAGWYDNSRDEFWCDECEEKHVEKGQGMDVQPEDVLP